MIAPDDRGSAIEAMSRADALVTMEQAWTADLAAALRAASRVRWIQLLNAGFDRLEAFGVPPHVVVSTIGGAGSHFVAEHALMLLLALLRKAPSMLHAQSRREWAFDSVVREISSLQGKEVAVLGFGHIGRRVAALAAALGARVVGIARSSRRDRDGFDVVSLADVRDVYPRADALVVALPLSADTAGLIDAAALGRMKEGAYLVNVSRGQIVVTDALVAALESGRLAGAGLDVVDPEPLPPGHPLWSLPNVIITPHVAWAGGGAAARRSIEDLVVENVRRFARGERVRNAAAIEYR
ncbi:MAG TPA: NAD(P)-dependent oxidoreductase [Gammaproteobacteria bacterium]